ncbi:Maltose operon transcriptional repressor MalR, LacI family [Planococcus halocryophilus Or1]|uniref:LacI family transcriptional regulator n=1 Tax=Planococcus halocryophilus TaxID=1215089 RepID=A0A1C7DV55_9BACL|nr:LacI family DNA-binding transcriptional regulator [Planococcus halocryophilus]ANU15198.1 LacI family transcriptional regulator [Planococcus halocryophilus]EMF47002.1 Maltose operon transcriptional repressor MalR, LacI family [Planococcus halocryophilus Or1]
MAITIKDVAKKAGVSPATVSRVIADNPRISVKTKAKVREVMKDMGYYPNFQARNLVANKSRTLGIIMENSAALAFQNPFFPEVLRGISTQAHDSKYGLYLSTGATLEEIYQEVVEMVQGRRVDGIILLYSKIGDPVLEFLRQSELPFAVVGRPHQDPFSVTHVNNDNINTAKDTVEYLIGLGHRHIAFVGGATDFVVSIDRMQGYKQALAKHNISFDVDYTVNQDFIQGKERESIRRLMALPVPPTAIVTHDDMVAYEVIGYLEDLEIGVPDDVSIIGFNNHTISRYLKPPLSTVDISIYELGLRAAELVLEKITDESTPPKQVVVPSRLIERGSCRRL